MWRNATARALTMLLTIGAAVVARADDGPPPLTPPAGPPPIIEVPQGPNPVQDNRAVLALPGINAPSTRVGRPPTPRVDSARPPSSLAPSADGGLPPLEMPGDRRRAANVSNPPATTLQPLPSDRFRTRVIESTPAESSLPPLDAPIPRASTSTRPSMPRGVVIPANPPTPPGLRPGRDLPLLEEIDERPLKDFKDKDQDQDVDEPAPPPAPARRSGLFSRFLPRGGMTPPSDSAIKAEPRTDPAADATIKRRIEHQAREAVGDRARSLDVRVLGRNITIQAHGTKFLQRRAIRRSLENLQGLSGYRSIIEVND